jgi:2-oxoglutarate ferredoxin oxidoreductase subunit beta
MLDNGVYGLTKNQTSPTSPRGLKSNTQPRGAWLDAMNPIATTLGMANVSFVAQTGDWVPDHIFETLRAAFHHRGFAFVRILQRCPQYTDQLFADAVRDPARVELLVHPEGIRAPQVERLFTNHLTHDPGDLGAAFRLAQPDGRLRLGLFYRNEAVPVYESVRAATPHSAEEKVRLLNEELDIYAV